MEYKPKYCTVKSITTWEKKQNTNTNCKTTCEIKTEIICFDIFC